MSELLGASHLLDEQYEIYVCPECGEYTTSLVAHYPEGVACQQDGHPQALKLTLSAKLWTIFEDYGYDGESPLTNEDFSIRAWPTEAAAQAWLDEYNAEAKRKHTVRLKGEIREVRL